MKNKFLLVIAMSLLSFTGYSQAGPQTGNDTALLGLPGDNLDLFAVLNIFQQSKTIEDFEKTLNLKETGINNLDLNLNDTVDFIKVVTKQEGTDFTFILQDDISKTEVQDIAVILVSKDKDGKVSMQIVGDKDLYGKDYVIEPKPVAPAATPNPAYTGADPVTASPAESTVVVVESAPIVQYVYSPVYVPYYPPYYYGYYPPYHAAFTVMAVSVYHHNNYYHHGGYHGGGYGNTVVIHNENNYNNYNNNSRHSSNTVNNNNQNGNYSKNNASARPSTGASASPSANQSRGSSATAKPSTSQSKGASTAAKPSNSKSKASSTSAKTSTSQSRSSSATRSSSMGSRSGGGGRRR
jgi:hypothetical protein